MKKERNAEQEEQRKKLEIIIDENNSEENGGMLSLPMCVCLGAALGLLIGDNLAIGICTGLLLGCGVYGVMAFIQIRKNKARAEAEQECEGKTEEDEAL